jgi:hypothetical protein
MAPQDPRHDGLASLTRTFERTWYGGRDAGEDDYRGAEALAGELISGASTARSSIVMNGPLAPDGGAA